MKNILKIALVGAIFMIPSCVGIDPDGLHHFVYFINNTDIPLYVSDYEHSYKDCVPAHSADSVIQIGLVPSTSCLGNLLYKGPHGYEWEEQHRILVFDVREWEDNSTNYIRTHTLMEMVVTMEEIQQINWCISFPPTEDMRDLTMTPSYEEIIAKYGAGD